MLLSQRDVPLRSDASCATAGTSDTDTDIGDYVSGWLAELKEGQGRNWIESSSKPEGSGWRCVVMFRHLDGDDRWGWGVSFLVNQADRRVVPGSLRCVGAG